MRTIHGGIGGPNQGRGTVLLTGATGFVGGELLRRLIGRTRRHVVCLVRSESDAGAVARGTAAYAEMAGHTPTASERTRVTWVAGDISRPHLGLNPERWEALAGEIEEIFHCAASTRFDLSLADAHATNFVGLREILRLAEAATERGGFRRLHHVSTAYAAGSTSTSVVADFLPADWAYEFRNTYERTKARAERLLRSQTRVPYTIYRPSIIVGDSQSGRTTSWNVVYYPMRLMALGRLRFAPAGGRALLDCVPVDFVADGILALGRRDDTAGRVFHLTTGETAITVHDVIEQTYAGLARQRREPVRIGTWALGPAAWWVLAQAYRAVLRGRARQAFDRFEQYAPYTRISSVYDNRRETTMLAEEGVRSPDPREFFPRIVDYALRCEFGRRHPDVVTAVAARTEVLAAAV